MRGLRNVLLGLLLAASVSGVTVWAQKPKPAANTTRWTLQIVSAPTDGTPTILPGRGNHLLDGDVTYDPAQSPEVSVTVRASDRQSSANSFELSLTNLNPYASKDVGSTPAWRWLSFRNVAFAPDAGVFSTAWGGYTANADWLAPLAAGTSYDWPFQGQRFRNLTACLRFRRPS